MRGKDPGKIKPGDKVELQVYGKNGPEPKPIEVLAARGGLIVHRNIGPKGFQVSQVGTGRALFPWAFKSKAGAARAMNAIAASGLDWNFASTNDYTGDHLDVLRSYRDQHLQDFI